LIKYIKSVLWRVAKRLSYMEDARCLNVKLEYSVIYITKFVLFYSKREGRRSTYSKYFKKYLCLFINFRPYYRLLNKQALHPILRPITYIKAKA